MLSISYLLFGMAGFTMAIDVEAGKWLFENIHRVFGVLGALAAYLGSLPVGGHCSVVPMPGFGPPACPPTTNFFVPKVSLDEIVHIAVYLSTGAGLGFGFKWLRKRKAKIDDSK